MIHDDQPKENDAVRLKDMICRFISESPENSLKGPMDEPAWAEPLTGFSSGDDPLYRQFKADIGEFYWTPDEIFRLSFHREPRELTVISWVLPQTEATKLDNRSQKDYPSERWSRSRNFGEQANLALARHVVEQLDGMGICAIAPVLSPHWQWQASEHYGFASNWSERHAAYVAGLGTFSLCDGLITPKGKAVRCGSVVAEVHIAPSRRPYKNHRAYCLFFSKKGKCGKCIARCPVGALSEKGHDKLKCRNFLFDVVAAYANERFGFASYGCGLCQTGVPCESCIPNDL